ncbi:potassium-transporting atpase c chain [Trichococcus palustris]|jgi:potassium-transporting ATPase KdpC subunit|uniref:Potassium-transporting ATPase KdpC subunit n=1 Tax=Trichococcus palustris TaxID=140314 RepID=A0A143YVC9_9LACT|nr:K(+)-transporting ATPase subunit C [Trichococcus palustris]CZQ99776.1 potassium-transporting atpase c chain [Trichococcus palustris]SFK86870.1 K+-transporting ATPase ATPase C chain [Trichococcus palustris]
MKKLGTSIRALMVFTVICGIVYPVAITGFSQLFFQDKANGSMITIENKEGTAEVVGSKLLGQTFTDPKYLIGRPQEVSNLSPSSDEQAAAVAGRVAFWEDLDPLNKEAVPAELVTAPASGVDPNLSQAAAAYQVNRIARERNLEPATVQAIIDEQTSGRAFSLFGEPVVNVLEVNLALDELSNG